MRLSICLALALVACSGDSKNPTSPVVLVGLDGADWDVIDQLISQGKMPNLARLMAQGSYGELETIEPILSPIIWTTIATGKGPEDHGITWFMERDVKAGGRIPVSSRMRQCEAIWNVASANGKQVGVVGWWASWPAETVNGWVISDHVAFHGFGLRGDSVKTELGRTYPETLDAEVAALLVRPSHISDGEVRRFMHVTDEELATRRGDDLVFSNPLHHFLFALATNKTYANLGRLTLTKLKPDLTMVYFEAIDSLSHLFMKYTDPPMDGLAADLREKFKDVVPEIYQRQDQIIGDLMAAAGPDATFVIVSDHGFKVGAARLSEVENTDVKQAHLWHEKQGVIIMSGPAIQPGKRLTARVHDVTPTVLYLMGVPVGQDMDGRIIVEAIKSEVLAENPPKSVPTHEKPRDKQLAAADKAAEAPAANIDPALLERLEALGYVGSGTTPEILLNRARIALDNRDVTAARAALNELLAAHPDHADGLLFSGHIEEAAGNWAAAEAAFSKVATAADPQKARAGKSRRAAALIQLDRAVEAEPILQALLAEKPDEVETAYHLALALERQQKYEPALAAYKALLKKEPKHAMALNNAGHCALLLKKRDEAKKYFSDAAAADPRHAESRFNLGLLLDQDGKAAEAQQKFREAAAASPTFANARWALATRAAQGGQLPEAEKWLAELVALTPKAPRVWTLRARVAAAAGRVEDAKKYVEQARSLDGAVVDEVLKTDAVLRQAVAAK